VFVTDTHRHTFNIGAAPLTVTPRLPALGCPYLRMPSSLELASDGFEGARVTVRGFESMDVDVARLT